MVGKFVTILLLLTYAGSVNVRQNAGPQGSGPTLAETTEWLENRLVGVAHGSRKTVVTYTLKKGKPPRETDRQNTDTHESVATAKFDGCILTLGQLTKGDDYSVMTTSTIPFDRLTLASWKVDRLDPSKTENPQQSSETKMVPASVVVITLEASTNVISYRRTSSGNVPPEWNAVPYEGISSSLLIRSDDEAMPSRLVNGFNHALKLCHTSAKPEPF
jgi:hypothetical protein